MPLRDTASIVVAAPRDRVEFALERREALRVAPDRFESAQGTFVLRETPAGTRVVCSGTQPFGRGRDELRHRLEAELFLVRKLVEEP